MSEKKLLLTSTNTLSFGPCTKQDTGAFRQTILVNVKYTHYCIKGHSHGVILSHYHDYTLISLGMAANYCIKYEIILCHHNLFDKVIIDIRKSV